MSPMEFAVSRPFYEVAEERSAQLAKWGVQDHPNFDPVLLAHNCSNERLAEHYEVPSEERGKFLCDLAFGRGEGTWAHILVEEVSEVFGAARYDTPALRKELVQVAAVALAWIEALDRGAESA